MLSVSSEELLISRGVLRVLHTRATSPTHRTIICYHCDTLVDRKCSVSVFLTDGQLKAQMLKLAQSKYLKLVGEHQGLVLFWEGECLLLGIVPVNVFCSF